jgi:hypothetical protein
VQALVTAGAGFLLAVLWFDLMFDSQVLAYRSAEMPDGVVGSISSYYRRVTTEAGPMSRLVALFMFVTVLGIVGQIVRSDGALAARWLSLGLAVVPIAVAGTHTVPRAVRLGARNDPIEVQAVMARAIFREHVFCLCLIATLLVVQLLWMK